MEIIPTEKSFGAEIQGIDVRKIHADQFESIYRAWLDHQVLLFRGQQLNDEELIVFSRRFGELDVAPIQETGRRFVEGYSEIYIVSNVIENAEPFGSLCYGDVRWYVGIERLVYA